MILIPIFTLELLRKVNLIYSKLICTAANENIARLVSIKRIT